MKEPHNPLGSQDIAGARRQRVSEDQTRLQGSPADGLEMREKSEPGGISDSSAYRLIDFGDGYRLESLGNYLVQRPCPAAEGYRRQKPHLWTNVDASFERRGNGQGEWFFHRPWPQELCWTLHSFRLDIRATPFGHLGLFPEQKENWDWVTTTVKRIQNHPGIHTVQALNLFAYTGGSTLAAAVGGANVVHVDASKPSVEAAKRNAGHSGLHDAPIRYITDDARAFVERENRRGNRYQMIILDPPAYGHGIKSQGKKGQGWRIQRDLWPLLENCFRLLHLETGALLLTGHSELGPDEIVPQLARLAPWKMHCEYGRMRVKDFSGRSLDSGFFIRATWNL